MKDLSDLNKMIALFHHLGFEFSGLHNPTRYGDTIYAGGTTIEMVGDNENRVHFYFDLEEDGGKVRGVRPTIF